MRIVTTNPDGTKRPATQAERLLVKMGCWLIIFRIVLFVLFMSIVLRPGWSTTDSIILLVSAWFVGGFSPKFRS